MGEIDWIRRAHGPSSGPRPNRQFATTWVNVQLRTTANTVYTHTHPILVCPPNRSCEQRSSWIQHGHCRRYRSDSYRLKLTGRKRYSRFSRYKCIACYDIEKQSHPSTRSVPKQRDNALRRHGADVSLDNRLWTSLTFPYGSYTVTIRARYTRIIRVCMYAENMTSPFDVCAETIICR